MARGWKKQNLLNHPIRTHVDKELGIAFTAKYKKLGLSESEALRQSIKLWLENDKEGNSNG